MLRLTMLDIYKLFGVLSKHGYRIGLEDGTIINDIIDDSDDTNEFTIEGIKYKAKDKLYIKIYKPLAKKDINSLLVNLLFVS